MSKYFPLIACLLLFSCKQATREFLVYEDIQEDNSKRILINSFQEDQIVRFSEIFDSVNFVKLETTEVSLIGRIDKILLTEDKFIILDAAKAEKVYVFDSNGSFLNVLGQKGHGPGEYDSPDDIAYDQYTGRVLICSNNDKKILTFELDGTFISEIKIDWWIATLSVIAPDRIALYLNNISQLTKVNNNIIIIDSKGGIVNEMMPLNDSYKSFSPPAKKTFSKYDHSTLFAPQHGRRIYEVNEDSISVKYFIDFEKYNIPAHIFNSTPKNELSRTLDKQDKYAYMNTSFETHNYLYVQAVYKRKLFDCFYSKKKEKFVSTAMYINDMNAIVPSGVFMHSKGDSLIGIVESDIFLTVQDIIGKVGNEKLSGKQVYAKLCSSGLIPKELVDGVSNAINNKDFEISPKEIHFINSIKDSDNPIIRICTLKKEKH